MYNKCQVNYFTHYSQSLYFYISTKEYRLLSMAVDPVHVVVSKLCALLDSYRWLLDSYVIVRL